VNRKISEKDKKTWDEFLSNNQKLPDKDNIQNKTIIKKTRSLDLHGENLDQANSIIENFIKKSYEDRIQKLIIVTGKGLHSNNDKDPYVSKDFGILKYSIPEFVRNNQDLMKIISNISEASVKDGGTGAFYIFLKKK
jgi:DNA-nicking Smr family endonuclease